MSKHKAILEVRELPKHPLQWLMLSLQHVFAMFGATVLVPLLTGLNTSVALVASGVGTLIFLAVTRFKVPTYLGSSFAYIVPIIAVSERWGVEDALVGGMVAGLVYGLVSLIITYTGVSWLMKLLPPVVIGPVIMVIGLSLAPTAVSMAMNGADGTYNGLFFFVALTTLAVTLLAMTYFKGMWSTVPILFGILAGYLVAAISGIVDFAPLREATFFHLPDFTIPFLDYSPTLNWAALALIVPVTLVTLTEHIGEQKVTSRIIGRETLLDPGMHRTVLGDGIAKTVASMLGGPPVTTYGENNGVMAITRVYSVFVLGGAALLAISFGFLGYVEGFIKTIPTPVMGGISILLFGVIASNGLRTIVESKVDLADKRNLTITAVILVIGIGGAALKVGNFSLEGMALATILGVVLNLILPKAAQEEVDIEETPLQSKRAANDF
ncbi:uracil-xanthine permease family protein [Exiguobacterium oxidotolerans]|uniref:Uracil permease n=1 Tax=Exiguobacterium oxidotolerans TaxID=223958 RepID=A0A653ICP9_9BACL|nr:solute carrier family 23 protein [Exiguobacterium oxidotolerans]VWX36825.1 uracil permease [Exiguobacterium oxidotolerans]